MERRSASRALLHSVSAYDLQPSIPKTWETLSKLLRDHVEEKQAEEKRGTLSAESAGAPAAAADSVPSPPSAGLTTGGGQGKGDGKSKGAGKGKG